MSRESFERAMLRDFSALTLTAAALIGLALIAPAWAVGVACILLIPVVVIGVIASALLSHRRDEPSQPGTDHAHISEQPAARTAPKTREPAASPPGWSARPNVVTAWVDHAWACHWAALHSYSVTRPGR